MMFDLQNYVPKRYFTPAEADAMLPELMSSVDDIRRLLEKARGLIGEGGPGDLAPDDRQQLEELRDSAQEIIEQIQAQGVHLKGVRPVLLDFPALRVGSEVYLCWREGETCVQFWHPVHTGYRGREPINFDDLSMWEWCS